MKAVNGNQSCDGHGAVVSVKICLYNESGDLPDGVWHITEICMQKKTLYSFFIVIKLVSVLFLVHFSIMYIYTGQQIADIRSKNEVFEDMERQVRGTRDVKEAVGSMEYAFFYYPGNSAYQMSGSNCEFLLETLRRNSVRRMVATLKERFPESCKGDSPAAWIEAYGYDRGRLAYFKTETEWYEKWYAHETIDIHLDRDTMDTKKCIIWVMAFIITFFMVSLSWVCSRLFNRREKQESQT